MGRTVSVIEVDGSHTDYLYQGNTVQVTDPAGKWKKFTTDAFGKLISVLDPDPLNQPSGTLTTTYAYDILNHLTTVTMPRATGTQTRTFNYTTGTNVGTLLLSNGMVTYTYNTDKTLAAKTDAMNQQFGLTYDNYKRVTQINLRQTVIRQFYYDTNPLDSTGTFSQYALGRLTAVQNAPTANADTFIEMYSYTQPGEVTKKRLRLSRSVQSHPFTIDLDATYSYDNEGRMTSVTYPQSSYIDDNLQVQPSPVTTYTYAFDTMGRPISMNGTGVDGWGNPATVNIVNGVQYGPASEMLQMSYFGSTETRQYNNRLQMTHLTVPGQLNISYNFASQNNSQISSQTDNLSGEQITYQYDALKRLYSASASAWTQSFTYDGFGNLTDKVGTGGAPTNHSPVNAATNQLTGYSYDANGNLITTGFGWDPENRMSYATFGGTQYAYDSKNKRIWTGNYTCPGGFCGPGYGWQFQSETVFFYGVDGKRLAAYTPQVKYSYGTPQSLYYLLGEERVYFGSKYIGNANTSLMSGGTTVGQDRLESAGKYFPYGDERNNPQWQNDTLKFATYTRDSATRLNYADQRFYISAASRFLSPDVGPASSRETQSFNKYAYSGGDPVNNYDPSGKFWVCVGDSFGTGGVNDASHHCLVGWDLWIAPRPLTVSEWDDVHGSPAQRREQQADTWFSALDGAVLGWSDVNASATSFNVTLTQEAYQLMIADGFVAAAGTIVLLPVPGVGEVVIVVAAAVVVIAGVAALYEWWIHRATDNPFTKPRPGGPCKYIGETPPGNNGIKTCMYSCPGYGAVTTFGCPGDQPCPSVDSNGWISIWH